MVELIVDGLKSALDIAKVDHPTRVVADRAFDGNANAIAVSMQAARTCGLVEHWAGGGRLRR